MSAQPRLRLSLTVEDASAVADALSYWVMAARDNYGSGYQHGNPDDAEERRTHRRVSRITDRLAARVEAAQ